MDYQKMTKDELIKKLEEQVHLAKAVEAKDKEIIELRRVLEEDGALKLNKKELEINALKKLNADLSAQNNEMIKTAKEYRSVLDNYNELKLENERLLRSLNSYVNLYRNTAKSIQGALENSVELESLIFEKISQGGLKNGE